MTADDMDRTGFVQQLAEILRSEGPPGPLIERALRLLGERLGAATVTFTDHEDDDPSVSIIAHEWCDGRMPALLGRRFVNQDFAQDDRLAASARGRAAFSTDVRADPQLLPPHREAFLALGAVAFYSLPYIANGRIKFALTLLMTEPHDWAVSERDLISDASVRMSTMLERDRALAAMQRSQQQQAELDRARTALEQSRRLSTLGLLLAGVSHELNNPLSIVGVENALLEDELAGTPLVAHCHVIGRAILRCRGLVQSYLSLARPASPHIQPVDVPALCHMALELVAHQWRPAGIEACCDFAADTGPWPTDADQLLQVLVNLILNAQRAMQGVAPARRVLTLRTRSGAGTLEIEVEDGGTGIDQEDLPRLFEPFFTTHGGDGGTGLGLALSSRIVTALGGSLVVQATSPEGTCMRVSLAKLPA